MKSNEEALTKAPAQSADSSLKANQEIVGLQQSMGGSSLDDLVPLSSVFSVPKAPTLGPIKRDPASTDYNIPDLKLNIEAPVQAGAPAPAPTFSSSPKAHCLGLGGAEQRAKR